MQRIVEKEKDITEYRAFARNVYSFTSNYGFHVVTVIIWF